MAIPIENAMMLVLQAKVSNILGVKVIMFVWRIRENSYSTYVSTIMNSSVPVQTTTKKLIFETIKDATKDGKLGNFTVDSTYTRMVKGRFTFLADSYDKRTPLKFISKCLAALTYFVITSSILAIF